MTLEVTDRMRDRIIDEGYNPSYGARPLRRAIMRLLEDSLAERLLEGDIKEGDSVIVDVDASGQVIVLNGERPRGLPGEPIPYYAYIKISFSLLPVAHIKGSAVEEFRATSKPSHARTSWLHQVYKK